MNAADPFLCDITGEILSECPCCDMEEPTDKAVIAEGIINSYGFHPERLASHRDEVYAMLSELPDEFRASKGGGWSFLNACNDRYGNQWTGLHQTMDHLFALGMGLGLARWVFARELWPVLPGGMPYVMFLDKEGS